MYTAKRSRGATSQVNALIIPLLLLLAGFQMRPFILGLVTDLRLGVLGFSRGVSDGYSSWWAATSDMRRLQQRNVELETEVGRLRSFYEVSHAAMRENDDLRAIIHNPARKPPMYAAKPFVIHQQANNHHLLLPPSVAKVTVGQLVTEHEHVVGTVDQVRDNGILVRLLTDANVTLPVYIDNSVVSGIVKGNGSNELRLCFVPDDAKVHVGDRLFVRHDTAMGESANATAVQTITQKHLVGFVSNIERSADRGFLKIAVAPAMRLDYDIWFTID